MTQYFTDFSEYTNNAKPSDWTERWSSQSGRFTVESNADAIGGKRLKHTSSHNGIEFLSWDTVGEVEDVEVVALMMQTSSTAGQCHLIVRASPDEQYGYSARFQADSKILIRSHKAGVATTIETINYGWQINKWYWMRFRVQGSELKIKVWEKGLDEPIEWLHEMTDTSVQGAGLVGVGKWNDTGVRYFDTFSAEIIETLEYKSSGVYETDNIPLMESCRIRWQETKPTDTDIIIEYATGETQGGWQEVSNGDIITSDTNLWIRATLSTEDTAITPILQDLWLEVASAPQDKILITMDWWGKFNNVHDKIKVLYDASKGSLAGAGGAVDSFEVEFTPQDLVQTPNPNEEELIKAYPYEISLDFKEIDFQSRYAEEHLKAYPYEIVLDLKHVSEINP